MLNPIKSIVTSASYMLFQWNYGRLSGLGTSIMSLPIFITVFFPSFFLIYYTPRLVDTDVNMNIILTMSNCYDFVNFSKLAFLYEHVKNISAPIILPCLVATSIMFIATLRIKWNGYSYTVYCSNMSFFHLV